MSYTDFGIENRVTKIPAADNGLDEVDICKAHTSFCKAATYNCLIAWC